MGSASFSPSVCHPSTLRMVIWPDAISAQNSMAAVSAEGSTVCVLMRRLNSSCRRSMAFVVRADFHWSLGVNKRRTGTPVARQHWWPAHCLTWNAPEC